MKIKETVTHEPSTGLGDCCDAPPPVPHEKNAPNLQSGWLKDMEVYVGGRGRRECPRCWSRRLPPVSLGGTWGAGSTHVLCGSWALREGTLTSGGLQEAFTICCLHHRSTIHTYFSSMATQKRDRTKGKMEQGEATSPRLCHMDTAAFLPQRCTHSYVFNPGHLP